MELAGKGGDIPDVYGIDDAETHRKTIELIYEVLREHFEKLITWTHKERVR